jgi:hypothetical protein
MMRLLRRSCLLVAFSLLTATATAVSTGDLPGGCQHARSTAG